MPAIWKKLGIINKIWSSSGRNTMANVTKIHPLDLAELIDERAKEGVLFAHKKDLPNIDEIIIDGRVYVQDVTAPRKMSGVV